MDISILISWRTRPRLVGWTLTFCPHCHDTTAVAVDELFKEVSVYFVPLVSSKTGYQCRCDVCNRALADGRPSVMVAMGDWQPASGLMRLAQLLRLPPPEKDAGEAMIHSLLSSATERSKLDALDVSFGLTTGCILGAILGAAAGWFLLPALLWQMDDLGRVFAGVLGGLVLGGLIGAALSAVVARRSLPYSVIRRAMENYSMDPNQVVAAAERYPRRIRFAAQRARDAHQFGVSDGLRTQ